MIRPVLDLMQTMPAFVYLIPAVLFFGLGPVPGAFATVIFAMPPVVRLTDLGIRQVPEDIVEATRSFGATSGQLLFKSSAPVGFTDHYGRSEPDNHDGSVYGCDCGYDLGRRVR